MIAEGASLPDLDVALPDDDLVRLPTYAGAPFVLYFYPKDDTSGCTREAQEFSDKLAEFKAVGTAVLGVSKDSPAKHRRFIDKYGLSVPLASDEDGKVIEAFGSWVEKTLYGRKYMGVDRSTFLFDSTGKLARIWRKVRVPGHVDEVLDAARALGT